MPSSNRQADLGHAQQLLLQLRESFLADLPERCDALESLTLSLGGEDGRGDGFDELYRKVHSLKGSAGTHGIPIISTICHRLEDHLESLDNENQQVDGEYIDIGLAYLDLIRQAAQAVAQQSADFTRIESELEQLQKDILGNKRLGLVVDSSPVMALMCKSALEQFPVQLTMVSDGQVALERLLDQKFDFLITGKELGKLNGVALSYAIRMSESQNRNIKIIMLTSERKENPGVATDFLIQKDKHFADNLRNAISQIIK